MPAPEHRTPRLTPRFFFGSGWPYLLVPFIPVAIALALADASDTLVFVASALGIIPTAALMSRATEELAAALRGPASALSQRHVRQRAGADIALFGSDRACTSW